MSICIWGQIITLNQDLSQAAPKNYSISLGQRQEVRFLITILGVVESKNKGYFYQKLREKNPTYSSNRVLKVLTKRLF